jgi:multiple sugar transport system permease protein
MSRRRPVGYLFVAPAFVHLFVFALLPIGWAFWISLHNWNLFKENKPLVGFENYHRVIGDERFWKAVGNSALYSLISVPVGMAVALAVALLVGQKLRGMAVFRTMYYLPAISSQVAIAMIWIYVYLPKTGLINATLGMVGVGDHTELAGGLITISNGTDFLNSMGWAMAALVFMSIWTGLGPRMILFLAGILAIPPSLYEAASLDGATGWRQFWKVTLPLLGPTTLFVMVTSTISAMQIFTPIYMMTKGGPAESTDMVGYHIYVEAWQNFRLGTASAQSFVLLLIVAAVAMVQFRLMKSQMQEAGAGAG